MTNLSPDVCRRFKAARIGKGLSQTALAQAVGCKQSAISMFEGGMATKISDDTVRKISEFLRVPLVEEEKACASPSASHPLGAAVLGFCPNCNCISNIPYVAGNDLFYRPVRHGTRLGNRCVDCGEILEIRCPVCGVPVNEGACCASCGGAYVTPVLPEGVDCLAYARARREEIIQIRSLG
ncbi:MAG: helix-turn-helix domain-containing protein [Kiritimatiellia bacterium]